MTKHKINWLELILQLFVVFVGVTLGFFVNDWANRRNNTNLETLHLTALAKDIDANYFVFKYRFAEDSTWLSKSKIILNSAMDKEIQPIDSIDIITELIGSRQKSLIKINALQILFNTGDINLIENVELKYALNNYQTNTIGSITILENSLYDFANSKVTELAMEYHFKEKDKIFVNKALSILSIIYDYKKSLNQVYKEAKIESVTLLHQINDSSPHLTINFVGELK